MGEFFRKLKRVHFWLICGLITILSLVFWMLAVSKLDDEREKRVTEIEGQFRKAGEIANAALIPNTKVAEEMDKLIQLRQTEIMEAWNIKFEQQNSEETGILTWAETLGPDFLRKVSPLRPIEKVLPFPLPDSDDRNLNIGQREDYRTYIFKELPRLAESIGAKWTAMPGTGSTRGYEQPGLQRFGQGGETLATQSVVEWSAEDQSQLLANHFTWGQLSGGGEFGNRRGAEVPVGGGDKPPTTLEILYTQEDLWVLRSLIKIIERTNDGATSRFNAAVKKIESIKIGKAAIQSTGSVTSVKTREEMETAQTGGVGADGMLSERSPFAEGSGEVEYQRNIDGDFGDGRAGPMIPDPAEGRYVDKDYSALPAEELRNVMKATESIDGEKAYLAVAKRVPVRLRVSIDQTKLPKLLIECANAELTVEVRQVRMNPKDDPMAFGNRGFEGQQPPGRPTGSSNDYGSQGGRFNGGLGGGLGGGLAAVNPFPFDVTAEIYGIVYIYNPVDKRALGIEEETTEDGIDPNNVTTTGVGGTPRG